MLYINKSFEDGVYDEPRRQPAIKATSKENMMMNSDEELIEWDYDLPKATHTQIIFYLLDARFRIKQ